MLLEITRDYCMVTGDYWRLLDGVTGDYWRLLEITRDYCIATGNYWRLLDGVTGDYDYWGLLEITGDYWGLMGISGLINTKRNLMAFMWSFPANCRSQFYPTWILRRTRSTLMAA